MGSKIPKMDYLLLCRDIDAVLEECLEGIIKQSNINRILIACANRFNLAEARVLLFKESETDYVITVDSDVYLKDNWVEEMWNYFNKRYDIISGRAVSNKDMYKHLCSLDIKDMERYGYLQCAIVKDSVGKGWNPVDYIKKSDDILFSKYSFENKFVWREVPVISMHCDSYKYNAFFQGYIGTILEINSGIYSKSKKIVSIFRSLIGGIKYSILLFSWLEFRNTMLRMVGSIMGICNLK